MIVKKKINRKKSYFLLSSLIPGLEENEKYIDAAEIVRQYQNDIQLVVKLLCDGRHYEEAIHEARGATENLGTFIRVFSTTEPQPPGLIN